MLRFVAAGGTACNPDPLRYTHNHIFLNTFLGLNWPRSRLANLCRHLCQQLKGKLGGTPVDEGGDLPIYASRYSCCSERHKLANCQVKTGRRPARGGRIRQGSSPFSHVAPSNDDCSRCQLVERHAKKGIERNYPHPSANSINRQGADKDSELAYVIMGSNRQLYRSSIATPKMPCTSVPHPLDPKVQQTAR